MAKSIVVSLPHALGVAEAKRRVNQQLEILRSEYIGKIGQSELSWTGDRADVRVMALGQTTTGQIDVTADTVRIEVQLPWLLAAISGKVEALLTKNAKDSLRLAPPKP
jgi:hypothetical protein